MRLEPSHKDLPHDKAQNTNVDDQNCNNSENIFSYKTVFPEKEPRPVYISLRESKLATTTQQQAIFEKGTIDERLNIMPTLHNDIMADGIEYVTLEECRLIADDGLVSGGTHYNVDGMTDISHLRNTLPNTADIKVLVQPLYAQSDSAEINEFTIPMQTSQHPINNTNITTNGIVAGGASQHIIPIGNFNPSLPTEPLPYEETLTMQKSSMEDNLEKSDESVDSGRNLTYLSSNDPSSLRYNQLQTQQIIYPINAMREFNKVSNGLDNSSQMDSRKAEFVASQQINISPNSSNKPGVSPQSSLSPTYSLPESPYVHIATAANNLSSHRISTNLEFNGPVSPSESSSSSGSQVSSVSSSNKSRMFMDDKRTRQYSESTLISNAMVTASRARHQSEGNVNCRSRTKKFHASRRSIDSKTDNSIKNGKRRSKNPMPEDSKDDKYWRRRAKNNEAAKRSREAKRNKEDEVLTRVETLENANNLLRRKLEEAKSEIRVLKTQLNKDEA